MTMVLFISLVKPLTSTKTLQLHTKPATGNHFPLIKRCTNKPWKPQISTIYADQIGAFLFSSSKLNLHFPWGSVAREPPYSDNSCHDFHNHSCWSYHRYRVIFPPRTNHFRYLSLATLLPPGNTMLTQAHQIRCR